LIFTATTGFTDDPLGPSSAIRAIYITELRSHIDTVRAKYLLGAFHWTDDPLGVATTVKAVHLTELRTALQQAYAEAAQTAPIYTDSTIVPEGTFIKAVHIKELRDAIIALEGK